MNKTRTIEIIFNIYRVLLSNYRDIKYSYACISPSPPNKFHKDFT